MAGAEALGVVVQPPERLLEPVEVATFLRREDGGLLALHGLGSLVGHVVGVRRQVGVARLAVGLGHLVEETERLERPRPLVEQPLLDVSELLLVQRHVILSAKQGIKPKKIMTIAVPVHAERPAQTFGHRADPVAVGRVLPPLRPLVAGQEHAPRPGTLPQAQDPIPMSTTQIHCRRCDDDVPALEKPPFRNELGTRIVAEICAYVLEGLAPAPDPADQPLRAGPPGPEVARVPLRADRAGAAQDGERRGDRHVPAGLHRVVSVATRRTYP